MIRLAAAGGLIGIAAASCLAVPARCDDGAMRIIEYNGQGSFKTAYGRLSFYIDAATTADDQKAPRVRGFVDGKPVFLVKLNAGQDASAVVKVVRLAGTEPQVVVQHFTNGAHCCTETKVAAPVGGSWIVIDAPPQDGDAGYLLKDLDGDGDVELVGADDSFLDAFAPYADSIAPIRIEKLAGGRLVDATRETRFRASVAASLARLEDPGEDGGAQWADNGFLAGWEATKILLGEGPAGWQRLLRSYDRKSDWTMQVCVDPVPLDACSDVHKRAVDFPEALRAHLLARGYITDVAAYPLPSATAGAAR